MNAKLNKALLAAADEVLGLPEDEMASNMDLNLYDDKLIDSVSSGALITNLADRLGKKIPMDKMEPEDFSTLNTIATAVERLVKL